MLIYTTVGDVRAARNQAAKELAGAAARVHAASQQKATSSNETYGKRPPVST